MLDYKRIIILTTGLSYGGAETQLVRLSVGLKKRGWDVHVISMTRPQAFQDVLQAHGIALHDLKMARGVPDIRALFRFRSLIKHIRPVIIHSHMVHANLFSRVSKLLAPAPPRICTAHSIFEGGAFREWAYRMTDPLCDLTTQVSQAGAERYVRIKAVPKHKMLWVPNGVDLSRFSFQKEQRDVLRAQMNVLNKFVWISIGRLTAAKDYPNLLHAFSKVHRQIPEAQLWVIGEGEDKQILLSLVETLNLAEHVTFLGIQENISDWLSAADAFVLSSAWEGLPMVVLEAGSVGQPVVVTDVGGNREIVKHQENGWLVPARDSDALAQAMITVMQLPPEKRIALGEQLRQFIYENYDMERILDRWEKIYEAFLAKKDA